MEEHDPGDCHHREEQAAPGCCNTGWRSQWTKTRWHFSLSAFGGKRVIVYSGDKEGVACGRTIFGPLRIPEGALTSVSWCFFQNYSFASLQGCRTVLCRWISIPSCRSQAWNCYRNEAGTLKIILTKGSKTYKICIKLNYTTKLDWDHLWDTFGSLL